MTDVGNADDQRVTVCQVLHSLNVGGAEVLAARLARGLGSEFRFVFACLDDIGPLGTELASDGFRVAPLSRSPGLDLPCARELARLCRSEGVDVLHAHQYTPFSYALLSGFFGRRPPVLFTEHGRWFPDLPRRKRMIFNRLMLRRRDRVVAVGQSVRRALIGNEGIPAERVEVIYNGVDLAPYAAGAERDAVRGELSLGANDFVAIQVARLDALKDHGTAVRAMARVIEQIPEARLLLVGEGPERAKIEAEIARCNLEGRVRLLGLRTDIPRLLAAADVFLLTSVSEGIPLTLIEAMGADLPVVSTNVGGVAEVVCDGETGLLAPSGDDAALAAALAQLAGDPARRRAFGAAGARRAHEQFTEAKNHDAYRELYLAMAGRTAK